VAISVPKGVDSWDERPSTTLAFLPILCGFATLREPRNCRRYSSRAVLVSSGGFGYDSPPPKLGARMDYEVQHSSRRCSITGREFAPGETYYSAIVAKGAEVIRSDFAADAWPGPPAEAIGWWKSQIPNRAEGKKHWAPNDVMLQFWDELAKEPDKGDMRYVLTLLLARRRVFRFEEEKGESPRRDALKVYCPRRDASYEVPLVAPAPERVEQIQEELASLLR